LTVGEFIERCASFLIIDLGGDWPASLSREGAAIAS